MQRKDSRTLFCVRENETLMVSMYQFPSYYLRVMANFIELSFNTVNSRIGLLLGLSCFLKLLDGDIIEGKAYSMGLVEFCDACHL